MTTLNPVFLRVLYQVSLDEKEIKSPWVGHQWLTRHGQIKKRPMLINQRVWTKGRTEKVFESCNLDVTCHNLVLFKALGIISHLLLCHQGKRVLVSFGSPPPPVLLGSVTSLTTNKVSMLWSSGAVRIIWNQQRVCSCRAAMSQCRHDASPLPFSHATGDRALTAPSSPSIFWSCHLPLPHLF